MKGNRTEFLIDLQEVKEKKQRQVHENFADLYDWLFTYIQSEANLREIVRAKRVFRHKLGIDEATEIDKILRIHFEHWLLFDHVTVVGSRLFDLFVRSKQSELSRQMLELCGILMLMHLEPVRIVKGKEGRIYYVPLFNEEMNPLEITPFIFEMDFSDNDLVLVRLAKVGFKKMLIGPSMVISPAFEEDIISRLKEVYEKGYTAYRKYLKEHGVDLLQFRKDQ